MSNIATFNHKGILINVSKSYLDEGKDIYEAVRFAWRLKKERANEYPFVFALVGGKIIDVFAVSEWRDVSEENFPEFAHRFVKQDKGRIGFVGKLADFDVRLAYIGKDVPSEYRGQFPCRYIDPATGENEEVAE
ncbi:MAG: hypothetical protein Q3971_06430 [Moraxella sp.]|nr:hypothetical protein [Moraxella sp.]